ACSFAPSCRYSLLLQAAFASFMPSASLAREDKQMITPTQLEFLRSIDTPTVCNLVEIVAPERRGHGYTGRHLHCPFPDLPPIVGFAKTVTFKAKDKVPLGEAGYMQKRLD